MSLGHGKRISSKRDIDRLRLQSNYETSQLLLYKFFLNEEAHFSNQLDQEATGYNFPTVIGSDCNFRPSQLKGIELLVDLNPSAIRKTIRSQNYEECMSSGVSVHEDSFISNSQRREQYMIEEEYQHTIEAATMLGIEYGEIDALAVKKMIEIEAKEYTLLQKNRFAPLQRD
ncbi:hypothetical protein RHSIM_Rhsim05G0212200 [Rhododendron simsii]|uniref:Uncharacterized protein n=1 Tax=Rhododendron simsii TaxID=118357 RepID=A0A834LQC9_RHOSS|nr:hypothetical protein RHSIM_Rhsim05G0212200 [Rhododendron simsii]